MSIFELFIRLLIYGCYRLIRFLVGVLQTPFWLLNGTLFEHMSKRPYEKAAHIQVIWFRHKYDLLLEQSLPQNFITTHETFAHPDVIQNTNVTLYYVTSKEAIFVESDPQTDVCHSDNGSFMRYTQYRHAQRLITMPIDDFHRVAEEIGRPKGKIVFVSNTARCGSTLICQIFESTGQCVGMCEPDALNALNQIVKEVDADTMDRITINTINMLCKPRDKPVAAYALKNTAPAIERTPLLQRLFPDDIQLFMYREGKAVAPSLVKLKLTLPLVKIVMMGCVLHPWIAKKGMDEMNLPSDDLYVKFKHEYSFCCHMWALINAKYLKYRKLGVKIDAVKFEHLVNNPLDSCTRILKYCQLPEEWAEVATDALKKDSQRNSVISTKKLSGFKIEFTDSIRQECDEICKNFGFGPFLETLNLEGTFTRPGDNNK